MRNTLRKSIGALPSFDEEAPQGSGHQPASPDVRMEMTYQGPASPFEGSPIILKEDPKSVVGSPQWVVEEEGITEQWEASAWKLPSIAEAQERRKQEIFNQGKASLWTKPEELALMGKLALSFLRLMCYT